MNSNQRKQILAALQNKYEVAGTKRKAAEQLNIPLSTLRMAENGQASDQTLERIGKRLGFNNGWVTAQTANYKRIHNICSHAQALGVSRAIAADPGTGKTHALKQYASQYGNVFYVEAEMYWTPRYFVQNLLFAMGVREEYSQLTQLMEILVKELEPLDKPLFIIDEADKLSQQALNLFKTLYNKTSAAYILAGTSTLKVSILNSVRKNKIGYREILSRVGGEFLGLHAVTMRDIELVCRANGINDDEYINEIARSTRKDLRAVKARIEEINLQKTNSHEQQEQN